MTRELLINLLLVCNGALTGIGVWEVFIRGRLQKIRNRKQDFQKFSDETQVFQDMVQRHLKKNDLARGLLENIVTFVIDGRQYSLLALFPKIAKVEKAWGEVDFMELVGPESWLDKFEHRFPSSGEWHDLLVIGGDGVGTIIHGPQITSLGHKSYGDGLGTAHFVRMTFWDEVRKVNCIEQALEELHLE
jgi:hypothetical protein